MTEVIVELALASHDGMLCVDIRRFYRPENPVVFAPAWRDLERITATTTVA